MATPALQLRVPTDEAEQWRAYAAAHGVTLSELVRDAMAKRIGAAPPPRPAKARRGGCSRSRFHRSGTYCRECGVVPS